MNCPSCQIKVPRDAINIQKDIAQCQNCGNIFSISAHVSSQKDDFSSSKSNTNDYDLARQSMYKDADLHNKSIQKTFDGKSTSDFDMNNPPQGAYINHLSDGVQISATTRSWKAFLIIPLAMIWLLGALTMFYYSRLFSDGEFNIQIILVELFHLLMVTYVWYLALMAFAGKVEVTLDNEGGYIFTGIGKIGKHKYFLWSDINNICEQVTSQNYKGKEANKKHHILLEGQKQIRFGGHLSSERRYYMVKMLEQVMQNRK